MAERQREEYLNAQKDFCFETVLSTERNLLLLKKAKEKGFFIRCYYVLTCDPKINVGRVLSRVCAGGHDVPEEKIIARYYRALQLIPDLIPLCDVCHIYDNSMSKPYRIFKKRKDEYWYCSKKGFWCKKDIVELTGIQSVKKASLNKDS